MLACQIDIPPTTTVAARDSHLQRVASEVTRRVQQYNANIQHRAVQQSNEKRTIQLVVLPELASIDYSRAAFEQLDSLAEPLQGKSAECWTRVATECNCHVAYGFARKDDTGYYISVAVAGPNGTLTGYYDKMHLAQYGASMEKEYFKRGTDLFTFDIDGFRLAPIICYDIRFPELSRSLALHHRVDAILHCGAYYRDESFYTWHDFVRTRALENQLYFLSLNRAGDKYGHSLFCPPWVDNTIPYTAFDPHREEFKVLTIDKHQMRQVRQTYSFLHDRLDTY